MKYVIKEHDTLFEGQVFSTLEDEFVYDVKENTLKIVGKKDIQEYIQSFQECALDKILERFLGLPDDKLVPLCESEIDSIVDIPLTKDDVMLSYSQFLEDCESYKKQLGLDEMMTADEVIKYLNSVSTNLKDVLEKKVKESEEKENEKTSI